MRTVACLLLLFVAPQFAASAVAQNLMAEARRHYDAAAYDEALSVLARAERSSRSQIIEVEQYRAFCLIALGRRTDAETAVAALVDADPLYVPSASPRVLSVMTEIRRHVLPGVARRLLESGRAAYTQKNLEKARENFELLLRVLADPAMQGRPETADLRTLAEGFVTLVTASAATAPVPAMEEAKPAEPPRAAPVMVPAMAIREVIPPWIPDHASARFEYNGSMRVKIGVDGKVKSASIEDSSHPAYDSRLLQAARSWLYKPATRDGEPVEFEKVIEVRLRPASQPQS